MSTSWEHYGLRVISGEERGARAAVIRAGLSLASPLYAAIMRLRNRKFDAGLGVKRLPRAVVSVGNLTTGGTGKTPVVRWLADALRTADERPAVLTRGYKAKPGETGDEQRMLENLLNQHGLAPVVVRAHARRYEGGLAVLDERADVSVFVLDDGFQHRRLARDFDLVLVDARQPFGFDRVIPRGLLREPVGGLARADAVLITRANQGDADAVAARVQTLNPRAPVYRCVHAHVGFRAADGTLRTPDALSGKRFFAFAGIGNPRGFDDQLRRQGGTAAGATWFGDHWHYTRPEIERLQSEAAAAGADVIVTTEKDWVKVESFVRGSDPLPVWRAELAVRFTGDDEARLLAQIQTAINSSRHP